MTVAEQPYYDAGGSARLAAAEDWLFWFTAPNRLICWTLRRHFPAMRSLCKIGCGTGVTLQAVQWNFPGLPPRGIDFSPAGPVWARNRVPQANLLQGDIHDLPAAAREADVLGIFDVLEQIPDDAGALSRLHAAFRPDGGLVLKVPQHRTLWRVANEVGHHRSSYARDGLIGKVRAAGFEVVAVISFVSLLLPALRLDQKHATAPADAHAELKLGRLPYSLFSRVMTLERWLIQAGCSFPAGGALLLLARRT